MVYIWVADSISIPRESSIFHTERHSTCATDGFDPWLIKESTNSTDIPVFCSWSV
uniref:Uncharacterized protein n=1 Tax=Anguilla anguilla TaxID=7936 RepID=A0A0E9QWD6_ANGAN